MGASGGDLGRRVGPWLAQPVLTAAARSEQDGERYQTTTPPHTGYYTGPRPAVRSAEALRLRQGPLEGVQSLDPVGRRRPPTPARCRPGRTESTSATIWVQEGDRVRRTADPQPLVAVDGHRGRSSMSGPTPLSDHGWLPRRRRQLDQREVAVPDIDEAGGPRGSTVVQSTGPAMAGSARRGVNGEVLDSPVGCAGRRAFGPGRGRRPVGAGDPHAADAEPSAIASRVGATASRPARTTTSTAAASSRMRREPMEPRRSGAVSSRPRTAATRSWSAPCRGRTEVEVAGQVAQAPLEVLVGEVGWRRGQADLLGGRRPQPVERTAEAWTSPSPPGTRGPRTSPVR